MWLTIIVVVLLLLVLRRVSALWASDAVGPMRRRVTAIVGPEQNGGEPVVLFLIGSRLNSWPAFFLHLPQVLRFLFLAGPTFNNVGANRKAHGLLNTRIHASVIDLLFGDGVVHIQYWKSLEALRTFNTSADHAASFGQYFRELVNTGAFAIWHELYVVRPGEYENVYGNCPLIGFGAIPGAKIVEIDKTLASATARMAATKE